MYSGSGDGRNSQTGNLIFVMLNKLRCHTHIISSQSDYLIRVQGSEIHMFNDKQCRSISVQKPTDLDLHFLLRQCMSCSAREGLIANPVLDCEKANQHHCPKVNKSNVCRRTYTEYAYTWKLRGHCIIRKLIRSTCR